MRASIRSLTAHAYTHAALLDYHVNKNAEFASRIFFNGLDKYDGDDGYVQAYLDYLHMINDQSNMRVVIERVVKDGEEDGKRKRQREEDDKLKGRGRKKGRPGGKHDAEQDDLETHLEPLWAFGCNPPQPADDDALHARGGGGGLGAVWWRYVMLERWTATELSTIAKAEERREVALGLHSPRVAILVDRYRFMDLLPCSSAMRRTIALLNRPDLAFASASTGAATPGLPGRVYPVPNTALLTPIDPMHPPADAHFLRRRYPGLGEAMLYALMRVGAGGGGEQMWNGPLYDADAVARLLRERVDEVRAGEWVDKGAVEAATAAADAEARADTAKRKRDDAVDAEDKDEAARVVDAPAGSGGDLFRQRRQNKMARQQ